MASFVQDDYVEYDFSDDNCMDSSDEGEEIETEASLSLPTGETLRNAISVKKQKELEFEQDMERAMDEIPDLDCPTLRHSESSEVINRRKRSKKSVKFEENVADDEAEMNADSKDCPKNSDEESSSEAQTEAEFDQKDPFFDPEADAKDEAWVNAQRAKHQPKSPEKPSKQGAKAHTDAILSCPACMTIVCIDCQRHEIYSNQYRAMFVMNCRVVFGEVLQVVEKLKKKRKRNKKSKFLPEAAASPLNEVDCSQTESVTPGTKLKDDQFHPVKCSVCTTEIAVFDQDEVYHFFNTLASLP